MALELTFREGIKFRDVLRAAFRSRTALEQVVFDRLGTKLDTITNDNSYTNVLASLIYWAEEQGKTPDLLAGVRTGNPADTLLRDFETQYKATRKADGGVALPARVLKAALRIKLVQALLALPVSATFQGRSAFLIGIPNNSSLNRDPNNPMIDLNTVLDQLDGLGKLEPEGWPLLLFLDNVAPVAEGVIAVTGVLKEVRTALEKVYGP